MDDLTALPNPRSGLDYNSDTFEILLPLGRCQFGELARPRTSIDSILVFVPMAENWPLSNDFDQW